MGGKGYNGDERMWDENMTAGWAFESDNDRRQRWLWHR